jgi:ketosteroid isomerase-like protein
MKLTEEQMIEALRENNDAINRGDFDKAIELADPEILFVRTGALPALRGADAVRAWMEPDAFESQTYELLDHEVNGNRVLTRSLTRARGAGSGIEMEIESLTLWSFNDAGRISRVEIFLLEQENEARRALRGD